MKLNMMNNVLPDRSRVLQMLRGLAGGFLGILILSYLSRYSGVPWLMAPFGASCVLLFAVPDSPLAQPRNVIGGHLITSAAGLLVLHYLGNSIPALALAAGLGIMLMQFARSVHPPAGADPIVILLAEVHPDWHFLLTPVLAGSVTLVLLALLINNAGGLRMWPVYWLSPQK